VVAAAVSRRPPAGRVSVEPDVITARMRYPELATALERHLRWARDFATAGDLDSAVDAIRDAHATFAELRVADHETLEDDRGRQA
jgi:hypothetical protein